MKTCRINASSVWRNLPHPLVLLGLMWYHTHAAARPTETTPGLRVCPLCRDPIHLVDGLGNRIEVEIKRVMTARAGGMAPMESPMESGGRVMRARHPWNHLGTCSNRAFPCSNRAPSFLIKVSFRNRCLWTRRSVFVLDSASLRMKSVFDGVGWCC